jgi:hypothetical protein
MICERARESGIKTFKEWIIHLSCLPVHKPGPNRCMDWLFYSKIKSDSSRVKPERINIWLRAAIWAGEWIETLA